MSTMTRGRAVGDNYFKLVRAFPLRPIRSQGQYEQAGKVLNRLLGRPQPAAASQGERDYLEALVLLADYFKLDAGLFV
jgi:hypothetical protein